MDVDPYRLAYNVLHCNWIKFGIPQEDIPPPKAEKVDSLDPIIPGFSTAVVLFQIASRKDLKSFLDNVCPTAHNLADVYTRFMNIMNNALPEDTILIDSPNDENASQDTIEEYLSEDSVEADLPKDIKKENLPNDASKEEMMVDIMKEKSLEDMKEGVIVDIVEEDLLVEDAMKEDLPEDYKKEGFLENAKKGPTENIVHSEDIPGLMAYSLAVCTELVLYERENEKNKEHMKSMPEMWEEYFNKNLKPLCEKAHYTQEHLKDYSKSMKCLEKFLNKFISENKFEYKEIADRFYGYTEIQVATVSPEHSQLKTEGRNLSKGVSFRKIKKKFAELKQICKCLPQNLKGEMANDEIPLMTDYSPSTPISPLN